MTSADMLYMTEQELVEVAGRAFRLGLRDGADGHALRSADQLALDLALPPRRVFHTRKVRQVYGAGYDIAAAARRLASTAA